MASWLSRNRQRVVQVAGTILAVVLIVLLLREDGMTAVVAAMKQIDPWDLLWAALLFLVSRMAVVGRWHVLLRSGGVDSVMEGATAGIVPAMRRIRPWGDVNVNLVPSR